MLLEIFVKLKVLSIKIIKNLIFLSPSLILIDFKLKDYAKLKESTT